MKFRHAPPVIAVQQGLVPHVERAHQLQCWDFQREVEGRDQPHAAKGPPEAIALLAIVVPRDSKAPGHEAHLQHRI